jgi:hypothetical protein
MEEIKKNLQRAYLALSYDLDKAVVDNLPTERLETARAKILDVLALIDE